MIAVEDIAYVRVDAPDLGAQEAFLTDFGMQTVLRTADVLYMRGYGTQPVIHVTHLRHDGFTNGLGLIASSHADLETTSRDLGLPVEANDEPGGGQVIRAIDPAGYRVDILFRPPVEPLPVRSVMPANVGGDRDGYTRRNQKVRLAAGPSHVLRTGHVVMKAPDCDASYAWYARHFNLRVSDSVHVPGQPERNMMIFANCGLGARYRDHHTIAFLGVPVPGFDHSAYEVIDWDDVMVGNAHLAAAEYEHSLGVGRHVGGSMVFDYWRDIGGNKIEHWCDGDRVNDGYEASHVPMGAEPIAVWGPEVTPAFFA